MDFGFWILDFGFWILDFGFWILVWGRFRGHFLDASYCNIIITVHADSGRRIFLISNLLCEDEYELGSFDSMVFDHEDWE